MSLPSVAYQLPQHPSPRGLIALVGEAPGADEVKQGKPFVGRSGQLLDKNLKQAGIDRAACLVANTFRFQPPKNKVAHFFISRRKAKEEGAALDERWGKFTSGFCRAEFGGELLNLQQTLQKLQPKVIVTLGATPLWALTGLSGVLSLRGKVQANTLTPGIPVLPTFHPSYILRGNWKEEPVFAEDLVQALTFLPK